MLAEMTELPQEFVGAWYRESIAIGDAAPSEPQQVWWLQTPLFFADLRLPRTPDVRPESFSGRTVAAGSRLTWHRDLDLQAAEGPDTGLVRWSGGALIEEGVTTVGGAPTRYVEVWRRMAGEKRGHCLSLRRVSVRGAGLPFGGSVEPTPRNVELPAGSDGPALGSAGPTDGRIVVVGRYAITTVNGVDGHVGAAWRQDDGVWVSQGHWPLDGVLPTAPPVTVSDAAPLQMAPLDVELLDVAALDVAALGLARLGVGDRVDCADGGDWVVEGVWRGTF
jgi:hypothetical protein